MKQNYVYKGVAVKGMTADQLAEILKAHYKENAGKLTAEMLVKDASKPKHPLHHYFEWNDKVAAIQWRLHQARMLIASLMIIREDGIKHRAFMNVMEDNEGELTSCGFNSEESCYLTAEDVYADERLRDSVIAKAKRDLIAFKVKYNSLIELKKVFDAIDEIV